MPKRHHTSGTTGRSHPPGVRHLRRSRRPDLVLTFGRRAARSPIGPAEDAREYARRLRWLPVDQVLGDFLFSLLNVAQVKLGRRDARRAARRTRDTGRLGPHPRHHGAAGLSGYRLRCRRQRHRQADVRRCPPLCPGPGPAPPRSHCPRRAPHASPTGRALAGRHEATRGASGPVLIVGLPGLSARPLTRLLEDEGWVRR
jgi:hypothetical protein